LIDLYYRPTPSGWKASIALEGLELAYQMISSARPHWFMVQPPLGESTWPVRNLDSSLAR
jgi:hypothetical protein